MEYTFLNSILESCAASSTSLKISIFSVDPYMEGFERIEQNFKNK